MMPSHDHALVGCVPTNGLPCTTLLYLTCESGVTGVTATGLLPSHGNGTELASRIPTATGIEEVHQEIEAESMVRSRFRWMDAWVG